MSDLLSWAEHEFKLNQPDDKGITSREHLKEVERQTGVTPKELKNPTEFPILLRHLWFAFVRLSKRRTSGFSGPDPLTPTFVKDWLDLSEEELRPWEVEAIFALDDKFMEVTRDRY